MEPIARGHPLPVAIDGRVIEAENHLEGQQVRLGGRALRNPRNWWLFRNPLKPTWGEPYTEIVARMRLAMRDAAGRRPPATRRSSSPTSCRSGWPAATPRAGGCAHDPRKRECALASVTSFTFIAAGSPRSATRRRPPT